MLSTRAQTQSHDSDSMVSVYITVDDNGIDRNALRALGVKTGFELNGMMTARIPLANLAELAKVRGVLYVQCSSPISQMLDKARSETGADKVLSGEELAVPYTGKGVIIGIVDAGFDYTHAAFYDKDRNLRIKRVWEQSGKPGGKYAAPEKYGYGIELKTREDIEGAGGDISNNSHGTHVAGIAAGSDSYMDGAFRGVAPDADIVLVSMGESSRDNVNISNALAYIFDYADEAGKPCVVNLSLGSHAGPHDGTSTFDVIADKMQGEGRIIVGSAGNHRNDKFHITRSFSSADNTPLKTFVQFKKTLSTSNVGGDIEIWGDAGSEFEVALSAYSIFNNTDVESCTVFPSDEAVQTVSLGRNISGNITVTSEISPLNGKPHVVLSSGISNIRTNYALAIKITPKSKGTVNVWADNTMVGLTDNGIEGFTKPSSESTIAEIGGTAKRILSVGAYTTRNEYTILGETESRSLDETVGEIGSFSSYGPTADGRVKPEVTAPGCFIISAESSNDASGTQIIAQRYSDGNREYRYGYMQGTSMSAPFVTGTVATWLQAYPKLTPEKLMEVVRKTSRKDSYTGSISASGDNSWGFGKIDVLAGLKECLELGTSGCTITEAPLNLVITKHDNNINIVFASGTRLAEIGICTAGGGVVCKKTIDNISSGEEVSLNIGELPKGIYLIKVYTGGGTKTVKFCR